MMELSGGSVGSFCTAGCSVCAGSVGAPVSWCVGLCGVGLSVWRWGRCAWWGFAGSGLRSQGGSGEEGLSRCALGRKGCSPPMLASTRPRGRPVAGVALGLRWGWGRCGGGRSFIAPVSWCVGLCGVGLSVWRWGGVPGGASRGQACARREALGRKGFRAARWGIKGVRLQCSLRPGPAGARWLGLRWGWGRCGGGRSFIAPVSWCVGLCGVGLSVWRWGGVPGGASRGRACARREALGSKGFRAARWGGKGVRLQCSLRPGPAGARWLGWRWSRAPE
jgi:hypothetical protein